MTEDYEILPHQVLQDLKGEVEQLKKRLMQPDAKMNELILEIESMKDSIHELHAVFQKALDEAKGEDVSTTIRTLKEKVENVVSQNETIAKALIAISDKIDDFTSNREVRPMARPGTPFQVPAMQHNFGAPMMPGPARTAPPPMMAPPGMGMGMPPPPPSASKRKGIFQ